MKDRQADTIGSGLATPLEDNGFRISKMTDILRIFEYTILIQASDIPSKDDF